MSERDELIALNDELRATFRGGQIVLDTGNWELSLQLRARALLYLSLHMPEFHSDGCHDAGLFVFAGFGFEWHIEREGADATLIVRVIDDLLDRVE